jgi:hypothetical protein
MRPTMGGRFMKDIRSRFLWAGVLWVLLFFGPGRAAEAVECLSPSYSVQKGREYRSDVEARDLREGEYRDLEELFQGLLGERSGTGRQLNCEGPEDAIRREIENFMIDAKAYIDSEGVFTLESTLVRARENTEQQESLRLFLGKTMLATRPLISASDIELVSVSREELTYVHKGRNQGLGGAVISQEALIRIGRSPAGTLVLEKTIFFFGRLTSHSIWNLERR